MPPLSHRSPAPRRARSTAWTAALAGVLTLTPCAAAAAATAPDEPTATRSSAAGLPLIAASRVSQVYEVDAPAGTWVITVRDDDFVSVILHEAGTGKRDNVTPEVRQELVERQQADVDDDPQDDDPRPAPPRTAPAEPESAEDDPAPRVPAEREVDDDEPVEEEPEPAPTRTGPAERPDEDEPVDEDAEQEEAQRDEGRAEVEVPEPGTPNPAGSDAGVPEVVEELAELAEDEDGAERTDPRASDTGDADDDEPAPTTSTDPTLAGADLTAADRARLAQFEAEWQKAKESCDEAAMRAVFDKYTDPDPQITRTVSEKVSIDTQEEADAARGTKFTGGGTIGGDFVLRDAIFEKAGGADNGYTFTGGTYVDVLWDGADDTSKAWQFDFRGPDIHVLFGELRRTQDGFKIDRKTSEVVARATMIHEPSPEKGGLEGNNTHQDGAQVQAGSFDFQKGMLDFRGNHGGGQGMIFGGDSGTMGPLTVKDNLLTSDRNMLTFQRRGPDRFPSEVDFGDVADGDNNVIAAGPGMGSVLSMYINAPVKMTGEDQADITEHTFKTAGECETVEFENGLKGENKGGPIPLATGESAAAAPAATSEPTSSGSTKDPVSTSRSSEPGEDRPVTSSRTSEAIEEDLEIPEVADEEPRPTSTSGASEDQSDEDEPEDKAS